MCFFKKKKNFTMISIILKGLPCKNYVCNLVIYLFILLLCSQSAMCGECTSLKDGVEFKYHNYSAMTTFLKQFTDCNSNLTSIYSIGKSVQKRELWVVKVSALPHDAKLVQNIKLLANIHGNEAAGREILLHFINFLVKSYWEGCPKVKYLLENNVIHILPSLNPDGFENAKEGGCTGGAGRHNVKDMDLNRSFPDYFRRNPKPLQPETKAVTKWMSEVQFILSASLHGGAMVANYPFESTKEDLSFPEKQESKSPDDDVFQHLALTYSNTHPKMHLGEPCPSAMNTKFPNGITNGAAWYPLTGGMQDYNYAMHGCMEVTLEVSCCKYPAASQLKNIWEENRDALMEYCLQSGLGVKGTVRDADTSESIRANLTVKHRNMTFTSTDRGEFFRILLPGQYKLKIQAENYKTKTVPFKVEPTKTAEFPKMTILDISLTPGNGSEIEDVPTTPKYDFMSTSYSQDTSAKQDSTTPEVIRLPEELMDHWNKREDVLVAKSGSEIKHLSVLALILVVGHSCRNA